MFASLLLLFCVGASFLLLVAGLSYLVGTFGETMAWNVPRNDILARMEADPVVIRADRRGCRSLPSRTSMGHILGDTFWA